MGQSAAVHLLHYTVLPAVLAVSFQFTQYRGASFGASAAIVVLTFLITYIPFVLFSTGGKL
jgi:hypothetical protein